MLVLFFVALWFILRGDLLYVFPCVILFLCFSVLLVLRLPRLGKREPIRFSYVCSICACLDLSVSSSSWGLGRAAVCHCGTPWTFLLPFFYSIGRLHHPHSSNISETAGSTQIEFYIKPLRHLANKHLLKWSNHVIRISALPI